LKRHVTGPSPAGRAAADPISSRATIGSVRRDFAAAARRSRCAAVSVSCGVRENARRGDEVVARDGQPDVVGAEVRVELARAEVGQRVPAADVVELHDGGKPLRDLEDRPVRRIVDAHAVDAERRHGEGPRDLEDEFAGARRERPRQVDFRQRVVDAERQRLAVGLQRLQRDAADETVRRPVAPAFGEHGVAEAVGPEAVLFEMQPEMAELLGRAVAVGDPRFPGHRPLRGVERRVDRVVGLLLPVAGTGRARRRTDVVRRRPRQGLEQRRVRRHERRRREFGVDDRRGRRRVFADGARAAQKRGAQENRRAAEGDRTEFG
jgi:hypothetical protein